MFDKYKFNGSFQLLFDGTGLSNHNYNLNDNCIKKNHKNGKVSYYKYVLKCKLVVGNIVISLDSEFIENVEVNNENQKQDCEMKAFKRMMKRIKKNYPKYKFIITGDALYATTPNRKYTKTKSVFPTDMSLLKCLYLSTKNITKKWTAPYQNWGPILSELSIMFDGRI